jgi:hypothetical protein
MLNPGAAATDPRDEGAFRAFKLRTAEEVAEANGNAAEATTLPMMLPLMTFGSFFFFPSALMGVGFMAVRSLGSSIECSSAASTSFLCVLGGGGGSLRHTAPPSGSLSLHLTSRPPCTYTSPSHACARSMAMAGVSMAASGGASRGPVSAAFGPLLGQVKGLFAPLLAPFLGGAAAPSQ